ncbi:PfkB family carbohydrate kinase [Vibrio sp. M260121]|uniref:PfkB family carbohydrate kinase n=1 Tax=Vibrio sp. M260121 TaxID=3020897 RepID=UPI003FCE1002
MAFFGECMIELSGDPIRKGFGGDTLNTVLYVSRLTAQQPIQVSYATGLGEDVLSQELLENWQQEGIATDLVEIFPAQLPGLYMVQTDQEGERSFLYWRDSAAVKSYFSTSSLNKLEAAIANRELDYLYQSFKLAAQQAKPIFAANVASVETVPVAESAIKVADLGLTLIELAKQGSDISQSDAEVYQRVINENAIIFDETIVAIVSPTELLLHTLTD